MAIDKTHVVVVDIEATCWKHAPPPGEQNEIIEVGVCLLNLETGESSLKRSILVKPTRSKVSHFCTKLTTLTQEQVDEGVTFAEACATLENDYDSKNRLWVSWGDYDRRMFEEQCASFHVPYPFSDRHMNLKQQFAALGNLSRAVGMARALKMLDMSMQGTHHRGHDDAWNISRIMARMLQRSGKDFVLPYLEG